MNYNKKYTNKYNFGETTYIWNPWEGCFKISEACTNCFIRSMNIFKDCYNPFPHLDVAPGTVITVCLKSDFFLEEADKYRHLAWAEIRKHPNLIFIIITKRIDRAAQCLPQDWGEGWENVVISVTAENQKRADERIPILLNLPLKHRQIACTPLLEEIDLTSYINTGKIDSVEVLGEKSYSHIPPRPLKYEWVANLHDQCVACSTRFCFLYLGHNFIMPDGSILRDRCTCYHSKEADDLNLSYYQPITFKLKDITITY